MKPDIVRKRLLKNKVTLYNIYNSDIQQRKVLIGQLTKYEVQTILQYLHLLCCGKVRMSKSDFDKIVSRKRLNRLRNGCERKPALRSLLESTEKGIDFLRGISVILPIVLRPMFEQE